MFNYYQWRTKDSSLSSVGQDDFEETSKAKKRKGNQLLIKKELNEILVQNYHRRIVTFLKQMKDQPIVQHDMYELRKRIRNCDREFNPFNKQQPSIIHDRPWQNVYSVNRSKSKETETYKRGQSFSASITKTPPAENPLDQSIVSKELESFDRSLEIKRSMRKNKEGQKAPGKRLSFDGKPLSKREISLIEDSKDGILAQQNKQSPSRIRSTSKKSNERYTSNFPDVQAQNTTQNPQSINQSFAENFQTLNRSFESKKPILYLPKLNDRFLSPSKSQTSSSKQKVYFNALRSLAIDANQRSFKLPANKTMNFQDIWLLYLEQKDPDELSKEARDILEKCKITQKKQSPEPL